MLVTLPGMVMLVRLEQLSKALSPMLVTLYTSPFSVTVSGIATLVAKGAQSITRAVQSVLLKSNTSTSSVLL